MNTPEGPYRFELHNPRRPWWTIYSSNGIRMFDFDSKFAAAEAAYALNAQHAEIERLRSELQKADNTIARERTESDGLVAALEAEIERLREERALWRHRLRIASAKMDGQHTWRLSSSDWPPLVGSNPDEVVRNALAAIRTQPMPAPPVEEE